MAHILDSFSAAKKKHCQSLYHNGKKILMAPIRTCPQKDLNTLCQRIQIMPVEEDKLDNLLTKFWEISKIPEENEIDDEITMKFQETVWFNEATGRYNVQPPWKSSMQDLPTNFIKISKND